MITAKFYNDEHKKMLGFHVSGHAGYADIGNDIACASVSSAVMMTANAVTEVFGLKAKVRVTENEIMLKLGEDADGIGDKLMLSLLMQLDMLSDEFPGCIRIENKQV